MLPHDHNIWVLIFEQLPQSIRWLLIVLTGGVFWFAQRLYLNHRERVDRLENLIIDHAKNVDTKLQGVNGKIDKLTLTILNRG